MRCSTTLRRWSIATRFALTTRFNWQDAWRSGPPRVASSPSSYAPIASCSTPPDARVWNSWTPASEPPLLRLGRVIPLARADHKVLAVLHVDRDGLVAAVGFHVLGTVIDVVLVPQLVGDVFEGLREVLHLEGEERLPAGLGGQVLQDLVAVGLDLRVVGRNRVDHDVGLLGHLERLFPALLALDRKDVVEGKS